MTDSNITHTSTDRNHGDGTTVRWYDADGETYGVVVPDDGEVSVVDCDGATVEPCNMAPVLRRSLIEAALASEPMLAFGIGDRVCGGEPGTEDYDEGRVLAVDGDQVTVGWDSGVRTTQSADLLEAL